MPLRAPRRRLVLVLIAAAAAVPKTLAQPLETVDHGPLSIEYPAGCRNRKFIKGHGHRKNDTVHTIIFSGDACPMIGPYSVEAGRLFPLRDLEKDFRQGPCKLISPHAGVLYKEWIEDGEKVGYYAICGGLQDARVKLDFNGIADTVRFHGVSRLQRPLNAELRALIEEVVRSLRYDARKASTDGNSAAGPGRKLRGPPRPGAGGTP